MKKDTYIEGDVYGEMKEHLLSLHDNYFRIRCMIVLWGWVNMKKVAPIPKEIIAVTA